MASLGRSEWPFEEIPRLQSPLAGFIFVCTVETAAEYLQRKLFGLPRHYIDSVKDIRKGLPLFLYNCSTKLLHGIYEAASDGGMNLEPNAWSTSKFGKAGAQATSRLPAQVRVRIREKRPALEDEVFRPVLFHYSGEKFRLQLSLSEVTDLFKLFQHQDDSSSRSRRCYNGLKGDSPWRKGRPLRVHSTDKENAARKRSAETTGSRSPYRASGFTRIRQGQQGTSPSERSGGSSEAGENKYHPMAYSFISLRTGVCTMLNCKTKLLPPECVQVWENWKNHKDEAGPSTESRPEPEAGSPRMEDMEGAFMSELVQGSNVRAAVDGYCSEVDKQEAEDEIKSEAILETAYASKDPEVLSSAPQTGEEAIKSGPGLYSKKLEAADTESPPLGSDKQEFAQQLPGFNVDRHAMFTELIHEICRPEAPSSWSSNKPVKPTGKEQELSPYRVLFQDRNRHLLREVLASLSEEAKLIKKAWDNSKQMCAVEEADKKIAAKGTDPLSLFVSLKEGVVKMKGNQNEEQGVGEEMLTNLRKPEVTTGFYIKLSQAELEQKLPPRSKFSVKTRDQQVKEHLSSMAGEGVGIVGRKNAM